MYGFISTVFFMQNWCPYFAFFQCTQSSSVFTKSQTKFTKQYRLTSETSAFEKQRTGLWSQALVSLKKYMPPPLPYFRVNICPLPLPHFASIFFAYLWSFHWPNYIVTLLRYFSFRLPHLNIPQTNWTRIFSERSLFYF